MGTTDDYSHTAVLSYKRFEYALDSLPTPTAIICKSANRASAVFTAYKGIKKQMSSAEIMSYARQQEMKFVSTEGLSVWVTLVVDRLSDKKNPLELRQLFERESAIGEEKAHNPRLLKPVDQFLALMDSLDHQCHDPNS